MRFWWPRLVQIKWKRADEIQVAQIAADRVRDQAKAEADKELALQEMELQAQAQVNTDAACTPPSHNRDAKSIKLPAFIDRKDELDYYLLRFERYAENDKWGINMWAIRLGAFLSGRARDVYTRRSNEDAIDYDKVQKALLTRYNFTEDG